MGGGDEGGEGGRRRYDGGHWRVDVCPGFCFSMRFEEQKRLVKLAN